MIPSLLALACAPPPAGETRTAPTATDSGGAVPSGTDHTGAPVTAVDDTGAVTVPAPGPFAATLAHLRFGCELINGDTVDRPSANDTHHRFNLLGTDLGVPVVAGSEVFLFFGDTVGYRQIWTWGEDPDSVAHLPLAALEADPSAVCRDLEVLVTPDVPSVAAGVDPSIRRDFAGAAMVAPLGTSVTDFVGDPAGPFPWMPGTFEVPTGGLYQDGRIWLFYAGLVDFGPPIRPTSSYLVRWDPQSSVPTYEIVRPVDALRGGAMGGGFVQVAPVRWGPDLYLFGTGDFRRSGVTLARLPATELATGAGTSFWDGTSFGSDPAVPPVFETDGVGELSVVARESDGLVLALYQRELKNADGWLIENRILLRAAPHPTGPWSEPLTVIDMADPGFQAAHCCTGATCPGERILHCDRAGLYGAYLLPALRVERAADGSIHVEAPFLVSTWDPYNVVTFTAEVDLAPLPASPGR